MLGILHLFVSTSSSPNATDAEASQCIHLGGGQNSGPVRAPVTVRAMLSCCFYFGPKKKEETTIFTA